ncbi:IS21 family transposase, partial [Rheinheimera sediminis]
LTRQYPPERLNQACAIANTHQLNRLKNIKAILCSNLDTVVTEDEKLPALPQHHENIRGPQSFH